MSGNSFFNIPKMTANIPSQTPEQGGNISDTLPKLSGNVITSSTSIDYEAMKKAVEEYISRLEILTDVIIEDDGTIEFIKSRMDDYIDKKAVNGLLYEDSMLWLTADGETIGTPVEINATVCD